MKPLLRPLAGLLCLSLAFPPQVLALRPEGAASAQVRGGLEERLTPAAAGGEEDPEMGRAPRPRASNRLTKTQWTAAVVAILLGLLGIVGLDQDPQQPVPEAQEPPAAQAQEQKPVFAKPGMWTEETVKAWGLEEALQELKQIAEDYQGKDPNRKKPAQAEAAQQLGRAMEIKRGLYGQFIQSYSGPSWGWLRNGTGKFPPEAIALKRKAVEGIIESFTKVGNPGIEYQEEMLAWILWARMVPELLAFVDMAEKEGLSSGIFRQVPRVYSMLPGMDPGLKLQGPVGKREIPVSILSARAVLQQLLAEYSLLLRRQRKEFEDRLQSTPIELEQLLRRSKEYEELSFLDSDYARMIREIAEINRAYLYPQELNWKLSVPNALLDEIPFQAQEIQRLQKLLTGMLRQAVEENGRQEAGAEESRPMDAEKFLGDYSESLRKADEAKRQEILGWMKQESLEIREITLPDQLTFYVRGKDLMSELPPALQNPEGISFVWKLLPLGPKEAWDKGGLILNDLARHGVYDLDNPSGLRVRDVEEGEAAQLKPGLLLAEALATLPPGSVLLGAELLPDSQGKVRLLLFSA